MGQILSGPDTSKEKIALSIKSISARATKCTEETGWPEKGQSVEVKKEEFTQSEALARSDNQNVPSPFPPDPPIPTDRSEVSGREVHSCIFKLCAA